jgi:PAS domain S-box-containing protein
LNFARINPEYSNLALLDPAGRVVAASSIRPADPKLSLAQHSPFDAALAAQGFFVSPLFKGEVTGRLAVILAQPVLGREGQRLGTLIVPLNLLELSRMLTYDPAESRVLVTVLDGTGAVVMRSFEAEKFIGRTYGNFATLRAKVRTAGETSGELPGFAGELRIFDTSELPGTPWLVTVSEPSELVFADARHHVWLALLLVTAVLLFVLVLLFYYARGLARPIAALAEAARAQAAGRLNATAPERGSAEIVQTAQAFNEMVAFRQQAEQSLQQSEHLYRTVIEQTGQMVYDYDLPRDQVTWFGRAAIEQITGLTIDELNGTGVAGWVNLLHPDDRPEAVARLKNCLATGEPCSAEYRLLHRDGRYRTVEERGVVLSGADGRFVRMLGRISDITERRRASAILGQERHLLRQIIDLVPHFIFAKDKHGRYLLANQASADVYDTTIENLIGKTDADVARNKDEARQFVADDAEVIRSGRPLTIAEERITDTKGKVRYLTTVKIPFQFAGETEPAVLGVSVDITELKEAELARQQMEKKLLETQKLESLGVLAGGIAHDFNNLLTGILGNAGLARMERPPGAREADHLEQIEKAAFRAAELCKQMLAYSGKGSFLVQRLDLNDLLEDTLQLLQISVSKRAALRMNLTRPLPPVQADSTQIRQVLVNLVINASEALDDRQGTITLSTGRINADASYLSGVHFAGVVTPGPYVYLEVSDNGTGMSPEILSKIFDPFFTTKFTGRGLGLAAVLGIVRGHRGAIKVYSEPGRGTTFKILLPATEGVAQELAARPIATGPWRGSGRVLVVDDEEAVRRVSAKMLQMVGFTVDTAADGHEALLLFESAATDYAVVLLDLTMPRLNGEETFRRLRQMRPELRVILMSGFNKVETINRFSGQGLAGFVQKPFELESLTAEIRRVLEAAPEKRT